jgi:hypothetical protein
VQVVDHGLHGRAVAFKRFAARLSWLFRTVIAAFRVSEQFAADQHAADLAGAGADFVQLGVAPQAAGRVFVDVAVAAEDLDRLAGHPGGLLGGVQDRPGGVLARGLALVAGRATAYT